MKVKTINEISDDEIVLKLAETSYNNEILVGYELKQLWGSLSKSERREWYTSTKRTYRLQAQDVLSTIYADMADTGYEEMAERLWNDTTDDLIERLQEILDEISSFASAVVYEATEPINPYAEVE